VCNPGSSVALNVPGLWLNVNAIPLSCPSSPALLLLPAAKQCQASQHSLLSAAWQTQRAQDKY
jgi:hypothetical protein